MRIVSAEKNLKKRIKPYDAEDDMDKALYNFAHNILICCPSVRPKEKVGHWDTKSYNLGYVQVCSVCGLRSYSIYSYCPECGARMESEDNHTDSV